MPDEGNKKGADRKRSRNHESFGYASLPGTGALRATHAPVPFGVWQCISHCFIGHYEHQCPAVWLPPRQESMHARAGQARGHSPSVSPQAQPHQANEGLKKAGRGGCSCAERFVQQTLEQTLQAAPEAWCSASFIDI